MSVSRRLAAALAIVGAGVLAYAVPASATGSNEGSDGSCIAHPAASDLVANLYPRQGIARVRAADGKNICADVLLSVYKVPDSWDGNGFNESAVPQTVITTVAGKVEGKTKLELTVPVPTCGSVQVDLYFPPEITTVHRAGHGSQLIQGYIWKNYEGGKPKLCEESTPTPTPTTPSASPTTPSTSPTTPVVTPTTPSVTPTTTAPATPSVTPTTTAPVTPTPSPTEGLGAPIPVPPQSSPPVLAETGSDSTVPLLGLGGALLLVGVILSVATRKRPSHA